MEDLSHLFPRGRIAALTPTRQDSVGGPHDNSAALTAPGGAADYGTPVVLDSAGARTEPDSNDARPSPFTEPDGSGSWRAAQRSLGLPERPRFTPGTRNDV